MATAIIQVTEDNGLDYGDAGNMEKTKVDLRVL